MTDYDQLFKELLSTFFSDFVALFLPKLRRYLDSSSLIFLDKETYSDVTGGEVMEADLVVKARFKGSEAFFLVHTEAQATAEKDFGRRMFKYFARLHEKHGLPVYPVAVLSFDRPKKEQSSFYKVGFPDLDVLLFNYAVIQLNRLDWRKYLRRRNPVAVALMSKMGIAPTERGKVKLKCVAKLLGLRLDGARERLVGTFIDRCLELNEEDMKQWKSEFDKLKPSDQGGVMKIATSFTQQGIDLGRKEGLEQGLEQGRQEGLQEGLQKGRQEEARSLVARLLQKRLGTKKKTVTGRLEALSLEELELLSEALLDFSTEQDLKNWLVARTQ